MSDQRAGGQTERFEVRVTSDSHFAWLRTRLAVERTMMAYMRTSVALIGFGFTIFQFLQKVQGIPGKTVHFPYAAWYLGLALIFCGVMAAVAALFEYRRLIRYMWHGGFSVLAGVSSEQRSGEQRKTPLYAITCVLIVIGIFAFFSVLLSIE
jgi:putative membrane protein